MNEFKVFVKSWKGTFILAILIISLSFVIRIIKITAIPVFGDEAIYIHWSQLMHDVPSLRFLPQSDGKQPLFMWILMFLVTRFKDPLMISRMLSVFTGSATLLGIFVLSFILFKSKKISLLSILFWAVSPYSFFYERVALVDSLLASMGVWTLIFAVLSAKTKRLDTALIAGFFLGGALLTKSPALYFVLMLPFTWIVSTWPERGKGKKIGKREFTHFVKLLSLSSVTALVGYLFYNILRLGENFHMIGRRNLDYVYPLNHIFENPIDPFTKNINNVYNWLWVMGPSLIIVFLLLSLLDIIRKSINIKFQKPSGEVSLLFIWGLLPIVISAFYAKVFTARYILYALPPLFILSTLIFVSVKKNQMLKKVLMFGLVIFILQALNSDFRLMYDPKSAVLPRIIRAGFFEEWTSGYGIKESADYLKKFQDDNPDENIVVGTEGYFGTLPDGLQMYLYDEKEITIIGVGQPVVELPNSLRESRDFGNVTFLLVNSTRLLKSEDDLGLELVSSYPKAQRPDGTIESLLLFKVK